MGALRTLPTAKKVNRKRPGRTGNPPPAPDFIAGSQDMSQHRRKGRRLALAVGPGMIGFDEVPDPVGFADHVETHLA
ncbi:hypothetical protein SAMN05443573_10781 [Celeribacter indicus]|nr:hypothetical protein SAMN05443573_10781 [Celeribacter indicus]